MKILHVTRSPVGVTKYGIQTSLDILIRGLTEYGHEVELITQGTIESIPLSRFEKWINCRYLQRMENRFGPGGENAMAVLRERVEIGIRAARVAKQMNMTHVHCHDPLLGYMYAFFRKIYGSSRRWGFTVHTYGRFAKQHPGVNTNKISLKSLQNQESKAFKQARWIHFPTETGMKQCIADLGDVKPTKRWSVIPHAVEVTTFSKKEARKILKIGEQDRVLVAIGALYPVKRFDLLLHSLANLPQNLINRIIILGDGPEKEHLLNLADNLNLIHLLEITTTNQVGLYLSSADIYVSTSQTESFGMANCEALLAGVPGVMSKVDAVPGVVGDAAWLAGDDPGTIARAIESILTSEEVQHQYKTRAATLTSSWPDRQEITRRYLQMYQAPPPPLT